MGRGSLGRPEKPSQKAATGTIAAFVLRRGTGTPGCYQIYWYGVGCGGEPSGDEEGRGGHQQEWFWKEGHGLVMWPGNGQESAAVISPNPNTFSSSEEKSRCCYVLKKESLPDKGVSLINYRNDP